MLAAAVNNVVALNLYARLGAAFAFLLFSSLGSAQNISGQRVAMAGPLANP